MKYLIDDANLEAIKRLNEFFPITGVTTNPNIIAAEEENIITRLKKIREIIGEEKELHAQVLSSSYAEIITEASWLRDAVKGNFFVKVPVSGEGLKAMSELKRQGYNVTATAIFTPQQALLSAKAGADYLAPYVNRLDNFSADGVSVVAEIVKMMKIYNLKAQVVAASFKSLQQIHNVAMSGAHAATISPDLLEQLVYHPLTSSAIMEFEEKGAPYYIYE